MERAQNPLVGRREFLYRGSRAAVVGLAMPSLLAACGTDTETEASNPQRGDSDAATDPQGTPLLADVLDFSLNSNEWEGAFGFVTLRVHRAVVDGKDAYYIRTDTSDRDMAGTDGLVFAPKLGGLAARGLSGEAYLFDGDDHPSVLSTQPGRDDYTAAWRVNTVRWKNEPGKVGSVEDVKAAEVRGDLRVFPSNAVLNAAIVKWSDGEMPVDAQLSDYLGGGQLIEAPDTDGLKVMFKLHECFPEVRYIVVDTSMEPMAEGMKVVHSPRLGGSRKAKATGRTNVFMNGLKGPGPMGFQPSVFDSKAGEPEWSPYWDHMTYAWKKGKRARVLTTEQEVHAARDAGDLDEFPGTPDTNGETFTVNCPVPVIAPNTFTG